MKTKRSKNHKTARLSSRQWACLKILGSCTTYYCARHGLKWQLYDSFKPGWRGASFSNNTLRSLSERGLVKCITLPAKACDQAVITDAGRQRLQQGPTTPSSPPRLRGGGRRNLIPGVRS